MIRSAIWRCKCGKNGVGGSDGWLAHFGLAHSEQRAGVGVHMSFGFAPNYSNGMRTSFWRDGYFPTPRVQGGE